MKVGSVEEFQGQVSLIISGSISTDFLIRNEALSLFRLCEVPESTSVSIFATPLGLSQIPVVLMVRKAKILLRYLFNNHSAVAVTRAKALLIIVGDPLVLSLDPLWRSFMNYIYLNDGWKGSEITWDPNAQVDGTIDYAAEIRRQATLT